MAAMPGAVASLFEKTSRKPEPVVNSSPLASRSSVLEAFAYTGW